MSLNEISGEKCVHLASVGQLQLNFVPKSSKISQNIFVSVVAIAIVAFPYHRPGNIFKKIIKFKRDDVVLSTKKKKRKNPKKRKEMKKKAGLRRSILPWTLP